MRNNPPQGVFVPPRTATLVVAASNASAKSKAQADYVCDGVADDVEINAAIGALTAGRTWIETVKLGGHFSISNPISLPDYTRLDISEADIKLANGANCNMITNTGSAYIEIIGGGTLDGNRANQTGASSVIYLISITHLRLNRIYALSAYDHNFYLSGIADFEIGELFCSDAGQFNFYLLGNSARGVIGEINGISSGNRGLAAGASGIIFASSTELAIGQVYHKSAASGGSGIDFYQVTNSSAGQLTAASNLGNGIEFNGCSELSVSSMTAYNNSHNGITINNSAYHLAISSIMSHTNGYNGVSIDTSQRTSLGSVNARNNSQSGAGTYDGVRLNDAADTLVGMLSANDDQGVKTQGYGLQETGTTDVTLVDIVDTAGNLTGGVKLIGVNSKLGAVTWGYITENSGASVGTGAQQTIAHGLAFTPTRQQIALTAGSATALPFHSADPDATNIYVTAASGQPWYWARVG